MATIVLINPRFELSYWGLDFALPILGAKAVHPVACLPLLAALTPSKHTIVLVDENVETIDFDRCAAADIVGITGMIVQRHRMKKILAELKKRGAFTVVGGPWVSAQESYFGDLADVVFVGEAEETWPRFLDEWSVGAHATRYEQAHKTDMAKVPIPRYDLLKMDKYAFANVQFTRGCPFTCEFCDIIVMFGRRPRLKSGQQIVAEIEALVQLGKRTIFIVDDNFIGNKVAIKPLLRLLIEWQRANGYPCDFLTEASLDLADDPELMSLMSEANIWLVFIGIESPNEDALRETGKLQNLRKAGGTMLEKVHRIQRAGMEVWSGMIVGFDADETSIFAAQEKFIGEARITLSMVGMLTAIPTTPLYERLAAEGRLDQSDTPEFGTNVIPKNMSRRDLRDGYIAILQNLNEPKAFLDRIEDLYSACGAAFQRGRIQYLRTHPWLRAKFNLRLALEASVLFLRLYHRSAGDELRRHYAKRLAALVSQRMNPLLIHSFLLRCAMHYHAYRMCEQLKHRANVVNSF